MPRVFPDRFTLEQVRQVLEEQQQGPYTAIPANATHFPNNKGIYVWCMRPEGYQPLSQHIAFPQPFTSQVVDQQGNHLVYVGTAGVGRGAANGSGLRERFRWHVCQHHTVSSVKSGFLSTLRITLGALLANDLLEADGVNTENLVNQFMADYLTLTYIPYAGAIEEIGPLINADEHQLITIIKPLLNIRANPNIHLLGHPSHQIKARRVNVNQATKHRLQQL